MIFTQCLECGRHYVTMKLTDSGNCVECQEFILGDNYTIDRLERLLKKYDMRAERCGLNGDWSVSALCVSTEGRANYDEGLLYVLDDEDGPEGNLVLVRRYYEDDRRDEDGNDHIEEVHQTTDPRVMMAIIGRELRREAKRPS